MIKLKTLGSILACPGMLTLADIPAEAKQVHKNLGHINAIFRADMLNSNKSYLEHIIGPAKYTNPPSAYTQVESRKYLVDGCVVEVGYKNDMVIYLGIRGVSLRCEFPLSRFIPHTPETHVEKLSNLTFGAFEMQVGPGVDQNFYSVDCLASCGNSAAPSVSLYHDGAHIDDFINILIEEDYPYKTSLTGGAFNSLVDLLVKRENSEYISSGNVRCDRKYQSSERKLFKNSRVKNVFVGFDLGSLAPSCGK